MPPSSPLSRVDADNKISDALLAADVASVAAADASIAVADTVAGGDVEEEATKDAAALTAKEDEKGNEEEEDKQDNEIADEDEDEEVNMAAGTETLGQEPASATQDPPADAQPPDAAASLDSIVVTAAPANAWADDVSSEVDDEPVVEAEVADEAETSQDDLDLVQTCISSGHQSNVNEALLSSLPSPSMHAPVTVQANAPYRPLTGGKSSTADFLPSAPCLGTAAAPTHSEISVTPEVLRAPTIPTDGCPAAAAPTLPPLTPLVPPQTSSLSLLFSNLISPAAALKPTIASTSSPSLTPQTTTPTAVDAPSSKAVDADAFIPVGRGRGANRSAQRAESVKVTTSECAAAATEHHLDGIHSSEGAGKSSVGEEAAHVVQEKINLSSMAEEDVQRLGGGQYFCRACQVSCGGAQAWEKHYLSVKHQRKLMKAKEREEQMEQEGQGDSEELNEEQAESGSRSGGYASGENSAGSSGANVEAPPSMPGGALELSSGAHLRVIRKMSGLMAEEDPEGVRSPPVVERAMRPSDPSGWATQSAATSTTDESSNCFSSSGGAAAAGGGEGPAGRVSGASFMEEDGSQQAAEGSGWQSHVSEQRPQRCSQHKQRCQPPVYCIHFIEGRCTYGDKCW